MTTHDDSFNAYWTEEKDWLVDVVPLPKDAPAEEHLETVNWIGRVYGFAAFTNTRMLAQVGDADPNFPAYELWFSFDSAEHKQRFLELVRQDGYADPDEQCCFDPPVSLEDLSDLRPPAYVLPKEDMDLITAVAALTMQTLAENSGSFKN